MSKTISSPKSPKRRYLRQLQAAILRHALYFSDVHADSVVTDLPPPEGVTPNTIGAAFAGLEGSGFIKPVGYKRSGRGCRHHGVSRVWRVCDQAGARRYLSALEKSHAKA